MLAGIEAAEQAGLSVKLNMVVMRGVNEDEIADFAAMTMEKERTVRFIEYMPAIRDRDWQSLVVPGAEILARLERTFDFAPVIRGELAGPAREFRIAGARGNIGMITALSRHFCQDCNRIRVTASGKIRTCLFSGAEFDLRPLLEAGDPAAVGQALQCLAAAKPERHCMDEQAADHTPFAMAQIGG